MSCGVVTEGSIEHLLRSEAMGGEGPCPGHRECEFTVEGSARTAPGLANHSTTKKGLSRQRLARDRGGTAPRTVHPRRRRFPRLPTAWAFSTRLPKLSNQQCGNSITLCVSSTPDGSRGLSSAFGTNRGIRGTKLLEAAAPPGRRAWRCVGALPDRKRKRLHGI